MSKTQKGYKILVRVKHTRDGLNATNDVNNSKGYKILVTLGQKPHDGLNAANDLKTSKGYKILIKDQLYT